MRDQQRRPLSNHGLIGDRAPVTDYFLKLLRIENKSNMQLPFPLDINVVKITAKEVTSRLPGLEHEPGEFRNTVLNHLYTSAYILSKGPASMQSITIFAAQKGQKELDFVTKHLAVSYGTMAIIRDLVNLYRNPSLSSSDILHSCQIYLDANKYNIDRAFEKSAIRRNMERRFSRPFPEHLSLWNHIAPHLRA